MGEDTRLVGITSGGAWLVERLQKDLGLSGAPSASNCLPPSCLRWRAMTQAHSVSKWRKTPDALQTKPPTQQERRADPSALYRGFAEGHRHPHPRHRRELHQRERPRGQEGAAA